MTKDQIEAEFEEWNENGYWIKEEVIDFAVFVMEAAIAEEREACATEINRLKRIEAAAKALIKGKGRFHTEQNMTALIDAVNDLNCGVK